MCLEFPIDQNPYALIFFLFTVAAPPAVYATNNDQYVLCGVFVFE